MIGKFEEHCLLALLRAGPAATASQVYEVLADKIGEGFKFGAVYTTLDRMTDKKWVKVETRAPVDGGRTRRHFTISGEGRKALDASLTETSRLSAGLDLPGFAAR